MVTWIYIDTEGSLIYEQKTQHDYDLIAVLGDSVRIECHLGHNQYELTISWQLWGFAGPNVGSRIFKKALNLDVTRGKYWTTWGIAGPRKHRWITLIVVDISYSNGVRRISSLEAAIFDFPLPIASGSVTNWCYQSHWLAGWRKYTCSTWNFVSISCTSWVIRFQRLEGATVDFPLPVWY